MNKKKINSIICKTSAFILVFPLLFTGCKKEDIKDTITPSATEVTGTDVVTDNQVKQNDSSEDSDEEKDMYITIDYICYSEKEDDLVINIPDIIERDGKKYEYTGQMEYVVTESMECVEQSIDLEVEDIEEAESSIEYTSPVTGQTYTLSADSFVWSDLTPIRKKVAETLDFSGYMYKPDMPKTKTITYFNKQTETEEECEGTLEDWGSSEQYWAQVEEPIRGSFERDASDFDYYETGVWNEDVQWEILVNIDNAVPMWEGYEEDVLKIARVSDEELPNYRITGAQWSGEKYYAVENINGNDVVVEKRDAEYSFEMKCKDYWATYVGYGESLGYKTHVSYFATVEEVLEALKKTDKTITKKDIADDIKILYKMTATATFKEIEE